MPKTRRLALPAILLIAASVAPAFPRGDGAATRFLPYENESEVVLIGADLTVENRLDRVTVAGSVDLTLDREGLAKAEALRALLERVCRAMAARGPLPPRIAAAPAPAVDNPFEPPVPARGGGCPTPASGI